MFYDERAKNYQNVEIAFEHILYYSLLDEVNKVTKILYIERLYDSSFLKITRWYKWEAS